MPKKVTEGEWFKEGVPPREELEQEANKCRDRAVADDAELEADATDSLPPKPSSVPDREWEEAQERAEKRIKQLLGRRKKAPEGS